jgi:hypothetical protein
MAVPTTRTPTTGPTTPTEPMPTSATEPTSAISPTVDPCVNSSFKTTSAQRSFENRKHKGLLKLILELFALIFQVFMQLIGGLPPTGTIPTPIPTGTIEPTPCGMAEPTHEMMPTEAASPTEETPMLTDGVEPTDEMGETVTNEPTEIAPSTEPTTPSTLGGNGLLKIIMSFFSFIFTLLLLLLGAK